MRGSPSMWTRQQSTPASATTPASSGEKRNAETSLTIVAPAPSAARATSSFVVSIETRAPARSRAPRRPGSRGAAPRRPRRARRPDRVDSPPTSRIAAPLAHQLQPVRDGGVGIEEDAVGGERVRRHVDDAHDLVRAHDSEVCAATWAPPRSNRHDRRPCQRASRRSCSTTTGCCSTPRRRWTRAESALFARHGQRLHPGSQAPADRLVAAPSRRPPWSGCSSCPAAARR